MAWILPFTTGIYLAQSGALDKIANSKRRWLITVLFFVLFVVFSAIRHKVYGAQIKIDTLLGICVIALSQTVISGLKRMGKGLEFIGIHSANIFMMHTFIYAYYFNKLIYAAYYPVFIFFVLLISSLIVSCGLEKLKKFIRYDELSTLLLQVGGTSD